MTPDLDAILIVNMRQGFPPTFGAGAAVIRVDRGTPWGNPFVMGRETERKEVCDKFEQYAVERLAKDPDWLKPLRGKDLVCWCAPKRCHAETLRRLAHDRPRRHQAAGSGNS